eukprot:jgi/Tetstr1/431589/TSEL_021120.t1
MFFASSQAQAYIVHERLTSLLALGFIRRDKRDMRWLPVRELAFLTERAQFVFLAIKAARFYQRELHDVLRTKDAWSGRVNMTHWLRRDLEWWAAVPNHNNRRSIYNPGDDLYACR